MLLRRYHDAKPTEVKPVGEEKTVASAKAAEPAKEKKATKTRRKS